MDGIFEDWAGISPSYTDATGDQGAGIIDFGRIWITNDETRLFIRFEVGPESNIQRNNSMYLYVDSDNNASTGQLTNGIGAEFSIAFGERRGYFYGATTENFNLNSIGFVELPTHSSTEFEVTLLLDATYNSTPLIQGTTLRFFLNDEIGVTHDQAPDAGHFVSYSIDSSTLPPYPHIPLEKTNSTDIRIMTYNVLTDGFFSRSAIFERILQAASPDIIATITVSRFPITSSWFIDGNLATIIDLPDASYPQDMLVINVHPPCCDNDDGRQEECDNIIASIRDKKGTGDIPPNSAIIITGDMNFVGYVQQLDTLRSGNIVDEVTYGPDHIPDWDGTPIVDEIAYHTARPCATTWRNESSSFCAGRLDYLIYSDSLLEVSHSYIIHTNEMTPDELTLYGLNLSDTTNASDHLPIIADLRFKKSHNFEGFLMY
jgi:hypothetical protein